MLLLMVDVNNLVEAFRIMLFGMLGVFVFIGLFYGLIRVLDRLFKVKKDS